MKKKPEYYNFKGLNLKDDVLEKISDINGIWDKYFEIDGEKMW